MNRIIKNEQELKDFCIEVRNRQYEVDSIKVDLSEIFDNINPFDWMNEYLEIIRIDNVDVVKLRNY